MCLKKNVFHKKIKTKIWILLWKIEDSIIFFGNVLTLNKVTLVQHCSAQSLQICIITSTNQKDHVNRQDCLQRLVSFFLCTALQGGGNYFLFLFFFFEKQCVNPFFFFRKFFFFIWNSFFLLVNFFFLLEFLFFY